MHERTRRAIDVAGHYVEVIEREESDAAETASGTVTYSATSKLFAADGQPLTDEGHGFYRMPFGVLLKLVD